MTNPDLSLEYELHQTGLKHIAGIDEAGRGAWAGPVVAAAVILPLERFDLAKQLNGVNDSKRMTSKQRSYWADQLCEIATAIGIGASTHQEVDELGLLPATRLAMKRSIADLTLHPEFLLIDHIKLPELDQPQKSLAYGDSRVLSIAAASIIAKVSRDSIMVDSEAQYPGYGFSRNKGYGTREHDIALQKLGPCSFHRYTYAPVAACGITSN